MTYSPFAKFTKVQKKTKKQNTAFEHIVRLKQIMQINKEINNR